MTGRKGKILIVDDEWESSIMGAVRRRMEDECWDSIVVEPEGQGLLAEEFESAALYALEVERPDGVLLDVRFGEHPDDRFKGLGILRKIVERHPGFAYTDVHPICSGAGAGDGRQGVSEVGCLD